MKDKEIVKSACVPLMRCIISTHLIASWDHLKHYSFVYVDKSEIMLSFLYNSKNEGSKNENSFYTYYSSGESKMIQ